MPDTLKIIEYAMLLGMVVLAFVAVQSMKLRRAVMFLGAFSLLSSFVYIFYHAPDVAIAEAVIGCTLSVILFLIALKKYRVVTIYFVTPDEEETNDKHIQEISEHLVHDLEHFLITHEFEPQLILTHLDDPDLHGTEDFDLLMVRRDNHVCIYAGSESYHTPFIRDYLESHEPTELEVDFFSLTAEVDYED